MARFSKFRLMAVVALLLALPLAGSAAAWQAQEGEQAAEEQGLEWEPQEGYVLPPQEVQELFARDLDYTTLDDLGPDGDHFLVPVEEPHSTLELISKETYRLASLELRPDTNRDWSLETEGDVGLTVFSLSSRSYTEIQVPEDTFVSHTTWSPDGDRLAYLAHRPGRTEVWVADVATGQAESWSGDAAIMATISARSGMLQWTPDGTVVSLMVPPDRGPEPEEDRVPDGPIIRHTRDREAATRTIPFLLDDPHDAALFEYYTTGQIAEFRPDAAPRPIGEPGMYSSVSVSPDGEHLLAERLDRPFSFIDSWRSFPRKTEVMDVEGNVLSTVIDQPLEEGRGFGDRGGDRPRELSWRVDGAGLTYLMREPRPEGDQDDAGDPGASDQDPDAGQSEEEEEEEDDARPDRVMLLAAPFDMEQAQVVVESEERLSNHVFSPEADRLFAEVSQEGDEGIATWDLSGDAPRRAMLVDYHGDDDPLELPGDLMTRRTPNGQQYALVSSDGARAYLEGDGYAEDFRPTPFIDAVAVTDGSTERVFEGSKETYDEPLMPLDRDLQRMTVSRESRTDFPESFLWTRDGTMEQVTDNQDPFPEVTAAHEEHFTYERRDGMEIHGRIAMPVGWVEGERVPAVFWTYPSEYDSVEDYEREKLEDINLNEFDHMSFRSNSEVWLTQGYALVVPDIPIVGEPYNDKFVQHLVDGMYGAIRKVDELGYVDVDRLGHGGHSYGAFATANILARSPFFKAGIAGDGAYNRSLTPTGFQREPRTVWEAPHIYVEMSPFFVADQIDTPLLMYHGMDDDNTGTWPIQSDRMIHALTSLGKTAVLYKYPYESHAPAAIEQQLDLWARWIEWFDFWVKGDSQGEELTEAGGQG